MTEQQPEAPPPGADAIRAYLKATGWTEGSPGLGEWRRDWCLVTVPADASPDVLRDVIALVARAEGRPEADVTVSVRSLAREPLVMPPDEFAAVQSVAAAFDPAEVARLREGARMLGKIVVGHSRAMEAARIELAQGSAKDAMEWILNSLPDVWDDPETKWDGAESAQAWFDRTEDFYRAAKEDAEPPAACSPSAASAVPLADGTGPADGTWRERAEAAEARLAAFEAHRPAVLDALRIAVADTAYGSRAERFTAALDALERSEEGH